MSSPDAVERSGLKQSQSQVNENVNRKKNYNQRTKVNTENNFERSETKSVEVQESLDNYGSPLNEYGSQEEANNQQESIQGYKATEISPLQDNYGVVEANQEEYGAPGQESDDLSNQITPPDSEYTALGDNDKTNSIAASAEEDYGAPLNQYDTNNIAIDEGYGAPGDYVNENETDDEYVDPVQIVEGYGSPTETENANNNNPNANVADKIPDNLYNAPELVDEFGYEEPLTSYGDGNKKTNRNRNPASRPLASVYAIDNGFGETPEYTFQSVDYDNDDLASYGRGSNPSLARYLTPPRSGQVVTHAEHNIAHAENIMGLEDKNIIADVENIMEELEKNQKHVSNAEHNNNKIRSVDPYYRV